MESSGARHRTLHTTRRTHRSAGVCASTDAERITQRESAAYVAAGGSDTAGNDGMQLRCGRPGCLRELVSSPGNLRARAYGVTGSAARYRPIAFPKAC